MRRGALGGSSGLAAVATLCLLAAACAPAGTPSGPAGEPPPSSVAPATSAATRAVEPTPGQPTGAQPTGGEPTDAGVGTTPPDEPWRSAELHDVRSGETLVIDDLTGRLVVIEPMAIWCVNCRVQQNEARAALDRLDSPDIVYISLDVDPNETEAELARYADERDYPWHFVIASRDLARSLAQTFGDQVLSPPSTPKIVITPDGQAEVSFGIKGADQLEAELAALLP